MPAVGLVRWDARLAAAASRHSLDMAAHTFMSHDGSDGSTFDVRMRDAGYPMAWGGENVAAGYDDIPGVVAAWMNSPGHCVNIMRVQFTDIGAACADRGGITAKYWTQLGGSTR